MEDLRTSEAWRVFRIQSELIDGIETMNELGPAVSIFGGARFPEDSAYYQTAHLREITERYIQGMLGARNIRYSLVHTERAPIIGAAIAGLMNL